MGYRERKKARTGKGTAQAGNNINNGILSHVTNGSNADKWFKMLYPSEIRMLYARGASPLERDVYCVLTRYGGALDGKLCHVPAETIAEELRVSSASVRRAEAGLVRKGIIERMEGAHKGHVAVFRVRAEAFEPLEVAEPKRNDVVTQTASKRNNIDTQSNF